jgi:hypothetical protein
MVSGGIRTSANTNNCAAFEMLRKKSHKCSEEWNVWWGTLLLKGNGTPRSHEGACDAENESKSKHFLHIIRER